MSAAEKKPPFGRRCPLAALAVAVLVSGCDLSHVPILDPKGPVAMAERNLLLTALVLMMIVAIPVFVMTLAFAWRYRASNTAARYTPDWCSSLKIDFLIWFVPALIILALGTLVWSNTPRLDPYRRINPAVRSFEVEVVAQDWKWLFIYPDEGIAVVNQLVFPSGVPLSLRITSDTVMNSFYIPALGSQIYAMAGMQTRLNLLADAPGRFAGRNALYSGAGFSSQHFQAMAVSPADLEAWLARVRQSPDRLDADTYRTLALPTRGHPIAYYSEIVPGLFDAIIAKYAHGSHTHGSYTHGSARGHTQDGAPGHARAAAPVAR